MSLDTDAATRDPPLMDCSHTGLANHPPLMGSIPMVVLLWLVPCVYYAALLTDGSFAFFRYVDCGMAFNNMLSHLIAGRFDIDADAIRYEVFVRDGRTYAYFGIFCAFLRLPLLALSRLQDTDITAASMFIAASLSWLFRLLALRTVLSRVPANAISPLLVSMLLLCFALHGESVEYLRPSIYQEVAFWADALASAFVFLLVRHVTHGRSSTSLISPNFAIMAGLALLARVSTGLGLYAATTFMLIVEIVRQTGGATAGPRIPAWRSRELWRRAAGNLFESRSTVIWAILAVFGVCAAIVNYGRWGNPFTFADLHLYKRSIDEFPDRIPRLNAYGEFNFLRLPYGLQYYFLPVWVLASGDGGLLFQAFQRRLIEAAELPPGTFLLSDPLLIVLGIAFALLARQTLRKVVPDIPLATAATAGLAVPAVLMLIAISMCFRYRMEFYPLLNTAALLGLFVLLRLRTIRMYQWLVPVLVVIVLVGIVSAHVSLLMYKLSPFGPVTDVVMSHGWSGLFLQQVRAYYPAAARLIAGWMH